MAHNRKSMAWRKLPFWERVEHQIDRTSPDGCHLWTGYKLSKGYGMAHDNKRHRLIHRAMWERVNGEIPNGMFVLHKCDTPSCVNPEHLFLGTILDNNRDRERKGRGNKVTGIKHSRPMAKITWEQVREIRKEFSANPHEYGIGSRLAKKYGVSQGTMSSIRHGKHWHENA